MSDSSPRSPRLMVVTQHPDFGGGVRTLLRALVDWARRERLPTSIAYSPLNRRDPVNGWRPGVREEEWSQLPAYCVGRRFPRIEAWHCRGNRAAWDSVLSRADMHHVICGYAITGMPQALSGRPYVLWVATSMDGDKQGRLQESRWKRIVFRLQERMLRRQERHVLEKAAWVFSLSPHTHVELLERGASADRMTLLHCPIDVERFVPRDARLEAPTVVWAARHQDPRKNTPLLMRAFARVAHRQPRPRLMLIGEGDGAALQRMAEELGFGDQLDFRGPCPDEEIPRLLASAAVFAMPSDQEGLGIAALEAMACGIPVVSTRCGGPTAFVIPGQTGMLADCHHEQQFAEGLDLLLRDEAARRRMGREARLLVEREYSPARFAAQLNEVYQRVWPSLAR